MDAETTSRLACAAAGIVAQFHAPALAASLATAMLDLERARMTAEDMRNGYGPDTTLMHRPPARNERSRRQDHAIYRFCVARPDGTMREQVRRLQRDVVRLERMRNSALAVLARMVRAGSPSIAFIEAFSVFDALGMDSIRVEELADDGRGYIRLGFTADGEPMRR
jgi:hypothetical protein